MAGITLRGALRRLTSVLVWLMITVIVVVPSLLLTCLVFRPSFSTRTLVPTTQPIPAPGTGSTYYLSWQQPSQFTASIFVSTSATLPANVSAFVDGAELVWQTDPQTLDNRYPRLRKRVSIKVPEAVVKDRSKTRALYMHVFAWQLPASPAASDFIPDMKDPYLVHAASQLVRWDNDFIMFSSSSTLKPDFSTSFSSNTNSGSTKLVAPKSISWAMSLENHAYSKETMPRHITKALAPTSSRILNQNKRYNPPLFVNSFTQDIPKPVQISSPSKANDTRINVDIELRGIKQGWITSKNKLIRVFEPDFVQTPPGKGGDKKKNEDVGRAILIALSALLYGFVSRLGVPSLLTIIYCLMFACVFSYLYIRAKALFWLSPTSRWIGYSRVTFAIYFVANIFASIKVLVSKASMDISILLILAVQLYILLVLTEAPLNPTAWYPCILKAMQSAKRTSDSNGAYSLADIESEVETGSEPTSPTTSDNNSNNKSQDVEYVVAVRRDIDSVALWWTTRLFFPLFILVVLFSIITHSTAKSDIGTFAYIMITFATVLQWIHWLPQVFINYRTLSGTWIPVTANAYEIIAALLVLLAISVSGYSLSFMSIASELPNYLFSVVLVSQWLFYRFHQ
ncbi:hypothetical protein H4R99_001197 [Coemansia sp. RSA 1722]|nr:hypothetical protein LPJ57_000509 [Coemansia sp. RSA 486]KAJ2237239.1 hypothetical protein IWW45_001114 [Coemansia sp. RSA 485]KAJ2601403.1 hypothetical protein GGF39_001250 [Coemansia sp. RSA 1721]KAJ2605338.1 hypothetical protein H4R99_001197 [Coemansia sp. RSA 1722]KAJ2638782.1 hypothetical protein GGF40_001380 [Coemansia sp. RSA 1286]